MLLDQCSVTWKKSGYRDDEETEVKDRHEELEKVFLLIFSADHLYEQFLNRHLAGTTKKRLPALDQK